MLATTWLPPEVPQRDVETNHGPKRAVQQVARRWHRDAGTARLEVVLRAWMNGSAGSQRATVASQPGSAAMGTKTPETDTTGR